MMPDADFTHLLHLTDERGTFEHALFCEARPEHGYCTDDMARVLVVAAREPRPLPAVRDLVGLSLRFLGEAQDLDGRYRNRMDHRGRWLDRPSVGDCWGRSLWGLGTAAARSATERVRENATAQFERAARHRSPSRRAMAFATLGAAEVLAANPTNRVARDLVTAAADGMTLSGDGPGWPWPEPRLAYANAALPEAMIAAGTLLERPALRENGFMLLRWLLDLQSLDGHLSVVPAGGAGFGDTRPGFDQQPIEVAAIADACARASAVDNDPRWSKGVTAAIEWFLGANDGARAMWDPATGGGFDGLHVDGVNLNQGAESTIALLSTLQHTRSMAAR